MSQSNGNGPNRRKEDIRAAGSAVVGGAGGYRVVALAGATSFGVLGADVGAAAGPVGIVAGAVIGLAAYGIYRVFK